MPLQDGEVIEGIGPAEFAGVNQAHEQVAHAGAAEGLIEKGVLAVKDRPFQRPFADIIVERGTRHAQEKRQLRPVLQQIPDGLAQRRVRLDQPLVELPHKPDVKFLHDRTAVGLVKLQACLR